MSASAEQQQNPWLNQVSWRPSLLLSVSEEPSGSFCRGEDVPRQAHPHTVVARLGRFYLIGWDVDRDDWRIYRLDRLLPRTPHGASFAPRVLPAPDAPAFLAARLKGSETKNEWPCQGEVIIDLPLRNIAPFIGEGSAEEITPHSSRVVIGAWSWIAVIAAVSRFDASFTVVGPEPLRAAARTLAGRLGHALHNERDDASEHRRDAPDVS